MNGSMTEVGEMNCCSRQGQIHWSCDRVDRWRNKEDIYIMLNMCDNGVKEIMQHMVLYCKRYEREKTDDRSSCG